MPEQEKVIEGLKELRAYFYAMAGIASSKQGRANHLGSARTIGDTLALLKAQVPKVMALEALERWDGAILVEYIGTFGQTISEWLLHMATGSKCVSFANARRSQVFFETAEYGKSWRCWTSRPTDAQREATPWNTN